MVTSRRVSCLRIGVLLIAAFLFPGGSWAVTATGTQISAQALVDCQDTVGIPMPTTTSNIVTVNVDYPAELTTGSAKKLADGQFVQLAGTVVIAGTPEMGDVFYVEASDRSTGIRVQTSAVVHEGDSVIVYGTLATVNGERQITATDVTPVSSGNPLPGALFLTHARLMVAPDTTGLLTRISGTITAAPAGAGYFYVDDGSALSDGSAYTGVRVYGTAPPNPVGKYVLVTGIPGTDLDNGGPIRLIRTRRSADISVIPGAP